MSIMMKEISPRYLDLSGLQAQRCLAERAWTKNGWEDVSHVNFYYKDVYPDAIKYSPKKVHTYDDIFKAMSKEWDKGHYNIGFPHHPQGGPYWVKISKPHVYQLAYTTNWTFLANNVKNPNERDKVLRGVEVYSHWGNAIVSIPI